VTPIHNTPASSTTTNTMTARSLLALVCSGLLALVFGAAAIPKLIDPASFAQDIANYQVLPGHWISYAAVFLPALEFAVAAGLLWRGTQRGAAVLACSMLLMFAGVMAQARVRGIDLSCGCFGAAFESKVSWWTVLRSLGLAGIAAFPSLQLGRTPLTSQPDVTPCP